MSDQFNTIAGWTLAAGIAALGLTLASSEMFHHKEFEKGGYPVEGEVSGGGGAAVAEIPIGQLMAAADPAKGEAVFAKCASCHNVTPGGANGTGPGLYGIVGKPIGKHPGFAYSADVAAHGGNWTFDALNQWLHKPKGYIAGTKMGFAGISKGEDRANLIAYLNKQGSNLPMPPVEAAAAPAADAKAAAPAVDAKPAADAAAK